MSREDLIEEVERMIRRAADSDKSDDALKFSQGACNAANAIAQLASLDRLSPQTRPLEPTS